MPRILLVDDDAETCKFLEELLEAPDRQFVSVQGPDTALMKIHHDSFDLLISDINLNAPRSGLDLLRRFRAPFREATAQFREVGWHDENVGHSLAHKRVVVLANGGRGRSPVADPARHEV